MFLASILGLRLTGPLTPSPKLGQGKGRRWQRPVTHFKGDLPVTPIMRLKSILSRFWPYAAIANGEVRLETITLEEEPREVEAWA